MKTKFTQLFKKCAIISFTLLTGMAHAATFTAISSGSWSSTSTWAGGLAPGGTIGGLDNVVINSGVTVSMDMDITVNSLLSYIQVNGTLNSTSSAQMLNINSGDLSGNGTLNLHHLRFGTIGTMSFTGTANIENMHNNNFSLSLVNQLNISDTLFLESGTVTFGSGGYLTLQANSVIQVDNGSMTLGSGVINNSNSHSVIYVGTDKTAGYELTGSGLTDVWIRLDDNSQTLSITGSVSVAGDVHQETGQLDINGGTLTLMGDYEANAGAMLIGSATSNLSIMHSGTLSSALMFNASGDDLNNLHIESSGGSVSLASNLTINGNMTIEDGDFVVTAGMLTMATGSDIEIGDGSFDLSGGTFNGSSAYNVSYTGSMSMESGYELMGSGLNNLSVDLDNESDSIGITNDITIDGTLSLENGNLDMNAYDITIDGMFSSTSTGWLNGDASSDLTISTATMNDTLHFNASANTINSLTINTTDGSDLMLNSDLRVQNLNMINGGVKIWDNDLWINTTGTITGASEDNYVMTMGNGTLNMRVNVSAPYVMYPVGTDEGYSPVGIQQNSGIDRYFNVNVWNGIWSAGTTGIDNALTESVVDRTWNITPNTPSTSFNANIILQWDASMEVNGFDRTNAYISHYTSSAWDVQTAGSATSISGGMYQMERTGVSSFSPFAVVDEDASVTVAELGQQQVIQLYPNPVRDVLTCVVNIKETTQVDVIDLTGKAVYSERLMGTTNTMSHYIDFSAMPNGVYFVRYSNSTGTTSYKIVKD